MVKLFFRRAATALAFVILAAGICTAQVEDDNARRSIKILSIGNSFSQDAVEQHLWELFDAAGIEAVIGNMYIGGCSLERHQANAEADRAAYRYRKIVCGIRSERSGVSLREALSDEDWDIVTLQQNSGNSGLYNTYRPALDSLVRYVRRRAGDAEIWFHQTWAYAKDANHGSFQLYGRNQRQMYDAIMRSSRCAVDDMPEICGIIPSGTAIQNARTTGLGDSLTRDGYHLELSYGRYTAACTWFEALSGLDVEHNTYAPATISAEQARLARLAAHHAVRRPFHVTAYDDMLVEERVEKLLAQMSIEEKIMQLNQYTAGRNDNVNNIGEAVKKIPAEIGSLIYFGESPETRNAIQRHAVEDSRLGIPILFGFDVIHGYRTVAPIPLAQGASWNTALTERICSDAAAESYYTGIDWTFSPMVDVARDPRWGRVAEGYGEDVRLTSRFGAAAVRGYQGANIGEREKIAACMKHYVGYGASEAGRDYVPTEISDQSLWDTYLPPFEAGIDAGAATVMSSFNIISGVPASANRRTMHDVLKQRWEFDGFIVSDWDAVRQLRSQGYAESDKAACEGAFNAALDMDMNDNIYRRHLPALIEEGRVSMADIDESVRRVLRIKFRLGLFDNPYVEVLPESERVLQPEAIANALQTAVESMVLLKNDNGALPLAKTAKIALVGPLADNGDDLLGSWYGRGRAAEVTTVRDGLEKAFGAENVICTPTEFEAMPDGKSLNTIYRSIKRSDAVVLCLGEKRKWSGENASRSDIRIPAAQQRLLEAVAERAHRDGRPVVVVLFNGRALDLSAVEPVADAVLEAWQPGTTGGDAVAALLSGAENPSGRLSVTFPRSVGQIPIYYNRRHSGRRGRQGLYQDIPSTPLYEFGYGLSYTTYSYSALELKALMRDGKEVVVGSEPLKLSEVARLRASVSVSNNGARDGKEVVQWYVTDPYSTITRPARELKHFEKRTIRSGETERFSFDADPLTDLGFVDGHGHLYIEGGVFTIEVGGKSVNFRME